MEHRILILDDDELLAETVCQILHTAGYASQHCQTVKEFFESCLNWRANIIVLDLKLADGDGVSVLKELASICPSVSIILMSGTDQRILDSAARISQALGLNLLGKLSKPFYPEQLTALLINKPNSQTRKTSLNLSSSNPQLLAPEDLWQALQRNELSLAYQPKIDCRSGLIVGVEALARWYSPDKGYVPPSLFIPLAEKSELIHHVTDTLIDIAFGWLANNLRPLTINQQGNFHLALNISASLLANENFVEYLNQKCARFGVLPECIHLELTESVTLDDPLVSNKLLTQLRLLGFSISIDDFGTGYSSLMQLAKLPFTELKIDKGFIQDLTGYGEIYQIVKATIRMAHSLGLHVTAEGVENEETMQLLKQLKCDIVQGYFVARPMSEEIFTKWVREHRQKPGFRYLTPDSPMKKNRDPLDRLTRLAARLTNLPACAIVEYQDGTCFLKSRVGIREAEYSIERQDYLNFYSKVQHISVEDETERDKYFVYPLLNQPYCFKYFASYPLWSDAGSLVGNLWLASPTSPHQNLLEPAGINQLTVLISKELSARYDFHIDEQTLLKNRYGFEWSAQRILDFINQQTLPLYLKTFRLTGASAATQRGIRTFTSSLRQSFHEADLLGRTDVCEFSALLVGQTTKHIEHLQQQLEKLLRHKCKKSHLDLSFESRDIECSDTPDSLQHLYLHPSIGP